MTLLHLEDNDLDAELIAAAILREWPSCRLTRVVSHEDFEQALVAGRIDLILSDHEIPGFSGIAALDIARGRLPDVPFIFLSGTIGEARAIEALRHGAADYVMKSARARLIPAIRAALAHRQEALEKRKAEEELVRSHERFQQIAESIDNFIVLLGAKGECLYANPAFYRLAGAGAEEPCEGFFDLVHPDDLPRLRKAIGGVTRTGQPEEISYRLRLPDGEVRELEVSLSTPRRPTTSGEAVLIAGRDVTERKKAERRIHEQASLIDKARDGVCLFDIEGEITIWNECAAKIYGRSSKQMIGTKIRESLFRGQEGQFRTAFALTLAAGEWHGEFHLVDPDDRPLIIESTWSLIHDVENKPRAILCIDTDITSRKQRERELQRTQRLEGLGMLAGGIAHDLNNFMSPVLMTVGLLRMSLQNPADLALLDTVEQSAASGSELVRQILLFARGGEGEYTEVHLGELVQQLIPFLKATLRRAVELQCNSEPGLWLISADPTQMKQVVLNLCVNARDASPRGAAVSLTARNRTVRDEAIHGFRGEIPRGRYVQLTVADSGTGIPDDVVEKIFDPFFTTKEAGKGSGLGLATTLGIVQAHEGYVQVETEVGRGTAFHIYFPAIE
jgi:PAS domain S-box-containing protein